MERVARAKLILKLLSRVVTQKRASETETVNDDACMYKWNRKKNGFFFVVHENGKSNFLGDFLKNYYDFFVYSMQNCHISSIDALLATHIMYSIHNFSIDKSFISYFVCVCESARDKAINHSVCLAMDKVKPKQKINTLNGVKLRKATRLKMGIVCIESMFQIDNENTAQITIEFMI